jgi:NAD+ kinase
MAERLRRVAVLTHYRSTETSEALAGLVAEARRLDLELLLTDDERRKHAVADDAGFVFVDEDGLRGADLCLVLGGDGSILRALGRLLGSGVPTTGVNFGNVGFLAAMQRDDWRSSFAKIVNGSYTIVDLLTVEARFNGHTAMAVNDVVLARERSHRVLHLVYEVSGTKVGEMLCDGMIIASPAGSTAYNLSCDGPLVVWDAEALVLNFIAPHSMGFRPLVLRADHVIRVHNASPSDAAEIIADGDDVGRLSSGDYVEIRAGESRARLLVQEGGSFYNNVEEKLFNRAPHAR